MRDILDNITRIERFTAGQDFATCEANEQALSASPHALLILIAAARRRGANIEAMMPDQPWADIRAIGNVLRHEYDGVDPRIIWRVIESGDLRSLKDAVAATIGRLAGDDGSGLP